MAQEASVGAALGPEVEAVEPSSEGPQCPQSGAKDPRQRAANTHSGFFSFLFF